MAAHIPEHCDGAGQAHSPSLLAPRSRLPMSVTLPSARSLLLCLRLPGYAATPPRAFPTAALSPLPPHMPLLSWVPSTGDVWCLSLCRTCGSGGMAKPPHPPCGCSWCRDMAGRPGLLPPLLPVVLGSAMSTLHSFPAWLLQTPGGEHQQEKEEEIFLMGSEQEGSFQATTTTTKPFHPLLNWCVWCTIPALVPRTCRHCHCPHLPPTSAAPPAPTLPGHYPHPLHIA